MNLRASNLPGCSLRLAVLIRSLAVLRRDSSAGKPAQLYQSDRVTAVRLTQEPYRDHYHEAGFNALFFVRAAHSWARDLRIVNADYGIGLMHAHFCTVEDVELATDFRRDTHSRGTWSLSSSHFAMQPGSSCLDSKGAALTLLGSNPWAHSR